MIHNLMERIVRLRTWIANIFFTALVLSPDLLSSPELVALIPVEYQRYVIAAAFIFNIWMRPRPAVIASDPEVLARAAADPDYSAGV